MIKPEMFNYKDKDSFYNKTINMESASEYDSYIRTNGVRTKIVILKKQTTDRRFMYVLEDILCLAAYNKTKVDPQQKQFILDLWDRYRLSDDFFHSFYDEFTKDYTLSEIRGTKVECVSFHMIPSIIYLVVEYLEKELTSPDEDIKSYTNECEYKCCKISATKEERSKEYNDRKYKKMVDIEKAIKSKKKLPVVIEPIPDSPRIFSKVKRWFNSFF